LERVSLFDPDWPEGFAYRPEFLTADEERDLASAIDQVAFDTFEMRGVVARRRVKFYGASYRDEATPPIPPFLLSLRAKAAAWAGVAPDDFAMALINEYTPGATIGWHRDAPQYGIVAGISLLSPCRLKLRPYVSPATAPRTGIRKTTHEVRLEPRSGYLITGLARSGYEHSIPATPQLRYSITFRTLR
jgi:alkylated DNA repair dioxygenase AlkB